VADPVDKTGIVIGEVEASIRADDQVYGSAPDRFSAFLLKQPTGGKVLHLFRLTLLKVDADNLIAGFLTPIPRAMESDEKVSMMLLGKLFPGIEGQA